MLSWRADLEIEFRDYGDLKDIFVNGRHRLYEIERAIVPLTFSTKCTLETSFEVPRIIHFVWTGPTLPKPYRENIIKMAAMNPGYKVMLWTDNGIATTNQSAEMELKQLITIKNVSSEMRYFYNVKYLENIDYLSVQERTDVIRYEVVYRYGG